jgi:hypothetical protein
MFGLLMSAEVNELYLPKNLDFTYNNPFQLLATSDGSTPQPGT